MLPLCKKVLIPLSLLEIIIEVLEALKPQDHSVIHYECAEILWRLKEIIQKLELRDAYSNIIFANDECERDIARVEYLRQKSYLSCTDTQ